MNVCRETAAIVALSVSNRKANAPTDVAITVKAEKWLTRRSSRAMPAPTTAAYRPASPIHSAREGVFTTDLPRPRPGPIGPLRH